MIRTILNIISQLSGILEFDQREHPLSTKVLRGVILQLCLTDCMLSLTCLKLQKWMFLLLSMIYISLWTERVLRWFNTRVKLSFFLKWSISLRQHWSPAVAANTAAAQPKENQLSPKIKLLSLKRTSDDRWSVMMMGSNIEWYTT